MSYQAGLSSCGGEFYSILFAYFVSTGKEPRTWCARQMLYIENIPSPRVIFSGFLILCPFDRIYIHFYPQTCCQSSQVQKWWDMLCVNTTHQPQTERVIEM